MSSEKRRARFEKANINFSREMRIRKDSELSKSLEKRNKSQTRIEQILRAKRQFQDKYQNLKDKVTYSRNSQLYNLSWVILKAYAQKQKEEKRNIQVSNYVAQKLQTFKLRRMVKSIKQYTDWQKQWVKNVQNNFKRQHLKSNFRDLYLNAIFNQIQRKNQKKTKQKTIRAIQLDSNLSKQQNINFKLKRIIKRQQQVLKTLVSYKLREQDLQKKRLDLIKRRNFWLNVSALKSWKFFTRKMIDFRSDPITQKFAELDGAIIMEDETLMVTESDDSCKYFDVNARLLNICRNIGAFPNAKQMEGSIIERRYNTRVDLEKYKKIIK